MNTKNIQKSISEPRFATYLLDTDGDADKALELYLWNCRLCESLYTPIHILEVSLRNNFHDKLSEVYGSHWYDDIKDNLLEKDISKIEEVKKRFLSKKKELNTDDIVATLSMGFWVGLLWRHYETKLWRPCIYNAFPNAPKPFTRSAAAKKLSVIKDLRNRIAHHEPVYNRNLPEMHSTLLETLGWMCEDTKQWLISNSTFDEVYSQKP
ncbi:MAG: Abi family protein [Proteobacteria bacterium]|nr:Abi family protein [Pseudomonadota bacterium]